MGDARKVSVIVPVFNRERYVAESIDSILATGYPNLEILVVDDGSTDSTPGILEEIRALAGTVVRVLRPAGRGPRGPSASRNLALAEAVGHYVCFLDSDDLMLPHRFERAVPLLDRNPALDGVIEVTELLFEDDREMDLWGDRARRYGPTVPTISPADFPAACLLERRCSMHTSNILVRSQLFARAGVFRPENQRSEDFHLWLRMLACGRFAVGGIDRPVTLYRRHGENVWTPHERDCIRDLGVLADILAWARRSPHVSRANARVLREAYRRKARWCLAMLRAERDRSGMIALAWSLLAADRSWLADRGFLANVSRGLLRLPAGSRGRETPA
jgi:glycosyltransferase involved in cell wall biosynthesis